MWKRYAYILFWIILLLFIPVTAVSSVRDRALHAVRPITAFFIQKNIQLANGVHSLAEIPQLRSNRTSLQEEVIALQQRLADEENIKRENAVLRSELSVTGSSRAFKKVFARVIMQGSDPLDRTLTVDAGTLAGVQVGQPATSQGFLLGRVIRSQENSSVIRLIISKDSRIQATLSDTHDLGLLVGDGSALHLSDIPQGIAVKEGSRVETSGLGGSLPQGIPIGQVGPIESQKSDLSQQFAIIPPHDPGQIDSLFILLFATP